MEFTHNLWSEKFQIWTQVTVNLSKRSDHMFIGVCFYSNSREGKEWHSPLFIISRFHTLIHIHSFLLWILSQTPIHQVVWDNRLNWILHHAIRLFHRILSSLMFPLFFPFTKFPFQYNSSTSQYELNFHLSLS